MPPRRHHVITRFTGFLALKRSTAGILLMVVLVGLGERMAERFLPIFLMALGGGALAIGLLNAMDNLLSALYAFPGGYLADRLGTRRALLIFNLVAMAGYAVVILVPAWQAPWATGSGAGNRARSVPEHRQAPAPPRGHRPGGAQGD